MHKKKKTILSIFLFLIVISLAVFLLFKKGAVVEAGWWNDSWSYRKALTINSDQVVGDLTDFPVLVSLTDTDLSAHAQEDGDDFIFIDKEGKKLKHEIESYASSTGVLVAWVKIPSLSSTVDTDIFMYYGNAGISNQQDAENVWDENYFAVWHMSESSGIIYDSTSNNYDLFSVGSPTYRQTGAIGYGILFDDANPDYFQRDGAISITAPMTMSAWFNDDSATTDDRNFVQISNKDVADHYSRLAQGETTTNIVHVGGKGGSTGEWAETVATYTDNTWNYATGIFESASSRTIYLNIVNSVNDTGSFTATGLDRINIGYEGDSSPGDAMSGLLDEIRISKIARSVIWMETEYNNQNNPSLFFAEQAEEVGPGPVGYWSFDEGYGTTAHDESGQGNDGTITGAVWKNEEECVSGSCLYFDGTDGTNVSIQPMGSYSKISICTWIKANSLVNEDSDANIDLLSESYHLRFDNSGILRFYIGTDAVYSSVYSSNVIEVNKWYNVCGVFDGIGVNPELYLNGVNVSDNQTSGNGNQSSSATSYIGQSISWSGQFHGYIDEVKIYPYARTADQIKQDYSAGLSGVKSNSGVSVAFGGSSDKWLSDGLVGYWKMDEIATTSGAIDSSGNGNDGTYYGNASTTGGKFGNGGVFDGDGDKVDMGIDKNYINGVESASMSAWIKAESFSGNNVILGVAKNNSGVVNGSSRLTCFLGTVGAVQCGGRSADSDSYQYEETTSTLNTGEWYSIVGVIDYKNDDIKIFVNGEEWATTGAVNFSQDTTSNTNSDGSSIGAEESSTSNPFEGQIDEVRIYNRALSKSEVKKLYEWAPRPVLHLKMDKKSGSTAYDTSGYGNDGGIFGANHVQGKYGSALGFDGVDDKITITHSESLNYNYTDSFSASLWIKTEKQNSEQGFLYKYDNPEWPINIRQSNTGNTVLFAMRDDTSTFYTAESTSIINDNKWHYIVAIHNAIDNNNYIYFDGVLEDTVSTVGLTSIANLSNIIIGGNPSSDWMDGKIDDVRIYNYARTQKQILEDMNGGGPASKMPVLHLSFDEGYGETVHDSSIHKNNGTAYVGTGGSQTATSSMWEKSGKVKGAMEFDGTDDYTKLLNSSSLNVQGNEMSVSAWIYPGTLVSSNRFIIGKYEGNQTTQWYFNVYQGKLQWNIAGTEHTELNASMSVNNWYHVMGIYNGDKVLLYIDGREVYSADESDSISDNAVSLGIGAGRLDSTPNYFFDGLIDEVKVWNFALNEDEIKEEYNLGGGIVMGGIGATANDNGTTITGASTEYCIPGDTATCTPPVLELKMDEKIGGTVYDTSGNGNDGTIYGATHSRGKLGSALSFDGSDGVDVSDQDYFSLSNNDITVAVWAKVPKSVSAVGDGMVGNTGRYFVAKDTQTPASNGEWGFENDNNTLLCFDLWQLSGSNHASVCDSRTVNDGEWHYYVATVDYLNELILYIDGAFTTSTTSFTGVMGNGIKDVQIGRRGDGNYFDGSIDDVKIYNYARTPAQIAWDYNKGKPVAHYKFDECSGGTIHDESGNGNHGTLNLGSSGVTATGTCASSSDSFWYNGKDGKKNGSGSFDGVSDGINLGIESSLNGATDFSVSAWIKSVSSDWQVIVQQRDSDKYIGAYSFSIEDQAPNTGKISYFVFGTDSNFQFEFYSNKLVNDGYWHHVVVTRDDSYGYIYIDGNFDNSDSGSIKDLDNTIQSFIGYSQRDASGYFDGQIDEVQIFNYALTAEQVKNLYNDGAVSFK